MCQARTVFLYSLNYRIADEYMKEDNHILVGTKTLSTRYTRIFHRSTTHEANTFIKTFEFSLKLMLSNVPNLPGVQVLPMNKSKLK